MRPGYYPSWIPIWACQLCESKHPSLTSTRSCSQGCLAEGRWRNRFKFVYRSRNTIQRVLSSNDRVLVLFKLNIYIYITLVSQVKVGIGWEKERITELIHIRVMLTSQDCRCQLLFYAHLMSKGYVIFFKQTFYCGKA